MAEDGGVDFKLYRYDPSMAAAVIFILLFLAISTLHFYQMVRTRIWILVPFVLGGFCTSPLPPSTHLSLTTKLISQQSNASATSAYATILYRSNTLTNLN
jgi:predicted MFS family arabinose efflux permease